MRLPDRADPVERIFAQKPPPPGEKMSRRHYFFASAKSLLSHNLFFPILVLKLDVLSALQVRLQRPRGIASSREGFKIVVSQPTIEWDA